MHIWGDEWFKKYGNQFYNAIDIFECRIRKWAKCGVCGKEKFGTYRDDFFQMWDGSLLQSLFGYKTVYPTKFESFIWHIDHHLIPGKKSKFGRIWHGLADLNRCTGLTKLVRKWQAKRLNKAAQITCKEYPDVIDELLMNVCFYKCIKPCKWGDVDGEKIHKKYWKTLYTNK